MNYECDNKIFKNGQPMALLTGSSNNIEKWIKKVANDSNSYIDWHYTGGIQL